MDWEILPETLEMGHSRGLAGGFLSDVSELGNYGRVESGLMEDVVNESDLLIQVEEVERSNSLTRLMGEYAQSTNVQVQGGNIKNVPSDFFGKVIDPMFGATTNEFILSSVPSVTNNSFTIDFTLFNASMPSNIESFFPSEYTVTMLLPLFNGVRAISTFLLAFVVLKSVLGSIKIAFGV